jgi:glutamine amidotransferase
MIGIVDYGAGNIKSVCNALNKIGASWRIITNSLKMETVSGLILPGVGSFGDAMNQLNSRGLTKAIKDYAAADRPFLGICLGLQLMFSHSEESPNVEGLGILEGEIRRIPSNDKLKVPHIGWNSINIQKSDGIFKKVDSGTFTYFVHSFYLDAADKSIVAATTHYGVEIDAAVEMGNVSACQFHPEKSGEQGLEILKAFAETVENNLRNEG